MDSLKIATNKKKNFNFKVGNLTIGKDLLIIAGPCAIENKDQIIQTAKAVKKSGANILRGGAYKPRTSPYSFQGLGEEGLKYLLEAKKITGLPIISEVMDTKEVQTISKYVDVIQIGARNMQNFELLKAVGKQNKPVLLKRGPSATINEWLNAAEYILKEGNEKVILCERGIRTFENYTRNTIDLSAVATVKNLTNLPIVVDPSHGTGRKELIESMSLASIASGADGLIIETHINPNESISDKDQTINPKELFKIIKKVKKLNEFMKKIK
ncbi:MAG: 3-deoxy-7-phosphoheptulonate synthase [Candidatus ainarchaeum sp.]|nr:3-deoxy-7-phosphoheptulonate synthase [Candidatus ainarchaeum sp.]